MLGVVTDTDLMGVGRDTPFALKSSIERARTARRSRRRARAPQRDHRPGGLERGSGRRGPRHRVLDRRRDAPAPRARDRRARGAAGALDVARASGARPARNRRSGPTRTTRSRSTAIPTRRTGRGRPLAEFVTSGLEAAGIPRCEGDVMATNHALRLSVQQWVGRFEYMDGPMQ